MKKKHILLIILLIAIDQIIKYFVALNNTNLSLNLIEINYTENTGMAYGIFNNSLMLIILSNIAIIAAILAYLVLRKNKSNLTINGMALILAGGISNLIDRIMRGFVIDYIDINNIINFPVFNISDICITIGVIFLVFAIMIKY